MSDDEITKLCAISMGLTVTKQAPPGIIDHGHYWLLPSWRDHYDPLHDDTQCMALVKKFKLNIGQLSVGCKVFTGGPAPYFDADSKDLNRAVCECVAQMEKDKR